MPRPNKGMPIDLSGYVADITTDGAGHFDALVPVETVTLQGTWDDGRLTCPLCGLRFAPPANVPGPVVTIIGEHTGKSHGPYPICDACAVQIVAEQES